MGNLFKSLAGRAVYFVLAVVLLLATILVFKITFTGTTKRSYRDRKTEKDFLLAGCVLSVATLGAFSLAFSKKKEVREEDEVIKLTGHKINNNPEGKLTLVDFTIEPLMEHSIYKCIKSIIEYRGEQKELFVHLADEADYDRITDAKEITVSGELKDDVWTLTINNAKLVNGVSTNLT